MWHYCWPFNQSVVCLIWFTICCYHFWFSIFFLFVFSCVCKFGIKSKAKQVSTNLFFFFCFFALFIVWLVARVLLLLCIPQNSLYICHLICAEIGKHNMGYLAWPRCENVRHIRVADVKMELDGQLRIAEHSSHGVAMVDQRLDAILK